MQMIACNQGAPCARRGTVLLYLLLCAAGLLSTSAALCQTITLRLDKAPLEQVFRAIEQQSTYRFTYVQKVLESSKPVTVQVMNASLPSVLDLVFSDQPLNYLVDAPYIIVKPKPSRPVVISREVSGRVLNEAGEGIGGATVQVKGTGEMTATTEDGQFVIDNLNEHAELVVSSIGYQPQTVAVNGQHYLEVRLHIAVSPMDETVVIAYGTTSRRYNTGSVVKVSGEAIGQQPVGNPLAALSGRVPGLLISQGSGVPGASFKVEIRGQTTLDPNLSRNDPLFIIDGVPFEAGNLPTNQLTSAANNPTSISQGGLSPLNVIEPSTIESIEVLKDADATAIYGSRGANGVILITTKKARTGKLTFTTRLQSGWSAITRAMPFLNTRDYLAMRREGLANDGVVATAANAPDLLLWDTTRYTDFRKLLTGQTARSTAAQVTLSGGTSQIKVLLNGHYRKETTVYRSDLNDQVAGMRLQVHYNSTDKRFTMDAVAGYSLDLNQLPQTDLTRYLNLPPNLLLYDSSGRLAWSDKGVVYNTLEGMGNPLAELNKRFKSRNSNVTNNLVLDYALVPSLHAKVSAGYTEYQTDESLTRPSTSLDRFSTTLPSAYFGATNQKSWITEPQLLWEQQRRRGRYSVLVGSTFQQKTMNSLSLTGTNYANDLLLHSISAAGQVRGSNNESDYRYTALFGRLHYEFNKKYLLNATARRDGSSRFGPQNRFSTFGALGGAWVLSQESFMKAVPAISFAKIRGSYGVTGNDQIGDYKFLNLWTNTSQPYEGVPGLYPRSLYNPVYGWEKTRKLEVAAEINFFKDQLQLSGGWYRNRSSNQLVNYSLPMLTGFSGVVQNLDALVENSGVEVLVSGVLAKGKAFNWTSSFNLTVPRNKLVSFPGLASSSYASQYVEGRSLSTYQKLRYLGVDPTSGLYTFDDVNKDGLWNTLDYQVLGDTDPRFYGGFSNSLTYKGFSLSLFVEFRKQPGLNYLNQLSSTVPGTLYNQPDVVLHRWLQPGDVTDVQKFTATFLGTTYSRLSLFKQSNGIYSDASFVRLKNAALSWQVPLTLRQKLRLQEGQFFLQGQNLLTLTRYQGSDPETQNFYMLPPLRTVVAGIQLNF